MSTGKHVLELGAGTGLVGLACTSLGAEQVWLSDLAENLPLLQRNLDANFGARAVASEWCGSTHAELVAPLTEDAGDALTGDGEAGCDTPAEKTRAQALALNWTVARLPAELFEDGDDRTSLSVDLILAADCVFWPALFDPLLDTLQRMHDAAAGTASHTTPRVLLSVQHRLGRTELFLKALGRRGWTADVLKGATAVWNTEIYELHVRQSQA